MERKITIVYKLDMDRLMRKNDRKTLLRIIPNEVREYELTQKSYARR